MKPITKKRTKALLLDLTVSSFVTLGVEHFLRKKIKNEAVHVFLTPTVVMWALEFAQLRKNGQTIGYKKMGLVLENETGSALTPVQILKRIGYRETWSTIDYLKNRKAFESKDGAVLPHDRFAKTVVKEQ